MALAADGRGMVLFHDGLGGADAGADGMTLTAMSYRDSVCSPEHRANGQSASSSLQQGGEVPADLCGAAP